MIEVFDTDPEVNAEEWSAYFEECRQWGIDPFQLSGLGSLEEFNDYDEIDDPTGEGEFEC
jgi:hypothetical protein